jgi:hypothetical protein
MYDSAACGHPLQASGNEPSAISHAIAVLHRALQHIGYRFETSMRMIWKPSNIVAGIVGAKLVEHQKWINHSKSGDTDSATQLHARTVRSGLSCNNL